MKAGDSLVDQSYPLPAHHYAMVVKITQGSNKVK